MMLQYSGSGYIDKLFYFLVIFFSVLLLFIIIFYPKADANTLYKSVKKYVAESAYLKPTEPGFGNNLYSANHYKNKRSLSSLATENSHELSLWSNAFNFKKTIDTQTDPRTGMLSAHIKVGSLLSNEGHGPDIDLEANYNSGTTADPDGLGYGWSWNLTHFNLESNHLTTSTGQNFYLKKSQNRWFPLYHKLQDIRIDGDKESAFMITYVNGLRETLNHDGYETELQQQNGWSVHFSYIPGTHLLQSVTDNKGRYITFYYKNDNIFIINKDALNESVISIIKKSKDEICNISFQSPQHYVISGLYIRYIGHLILQIDYPTGLIKKFYYDCKSAMKIPASDNASNHALCVITKVSVVPGANQPIMTMHYYYSGANQNEHNYLGFNSGLSVFSHSFKDTLFEAPVNYTYQTITDNGLVREIRTYNKYHLLIDDKKINVHTGKKSSEVQTFFCQQNDPDGCAHSSFENLPVYYSLPLKIMTKLWSNNVAYPAISTETISYDEYGRTSRYKDSYGRMTITKYCPEQGDAACPPVPHGWLLGNLTESVIRYPAAVITETAIPPPVTVYNYYRKMPAHTGNSYTMVVDHEITRAQQQYIETKYNYYQDPDNSFLYGLLKQTILTGSTDKASAITSVSKHYYYIKSANNQAKTTYTSVDLKSGKSRLSSTITTSLLTNQTLQTTDATGLNITRYHYDFMGRLIQTDYVVGTPFASSDYYAYNVSPILNQLLITSATNLQQKIIFDGAGRMLICFNQAIAAAGKPIPDRWFPVQGISYDHYGRVLEEHTYIIKKPDIIHTFTITYNYDDSGRIIKTHLSDNREVITEYDDADRCVVHYEKSSTGNYSAISVVHANILYQPIINLLLPAPAQPPPAAYHLCHLSDDIINVNGIKVSAANYDTFGRAVKLTDSMGHIVKTSYDGLGSVTTITDPAGNRVHSVYDLSGHLIQSWAYPISGGHYLLSSAEYNNAGELLWSAGEDGHHSTFTYNENNQLLNATIPAGHTLSLRYNVLGLPVAQSLDGKLQLRLHYDPVTTLLKEKIGITGTTTFIYDTDGLIRQLIHSGKNGYADYKLNWEYDLNRRLVSTTDIAGNKTQIVYDIHGRLKKMIYQPLNSKAETVGSSVYDDFSRIKALHYGSGMNRKFRYDAFDRLLEMNDTLNSCHLYNEHLHYDTNNNITTIIQQNNRSEYAKLNYNYDALNNLVSMTCTGSDGLSLCPRDTNVSGSNLTGAAVITRQNYTFTSLNRLAGVREILQNLSTGKTITKNMHYYYSDPQVPLRLQQTDTIWNHQTAVTHHFNYDVMGNMITDGEGNHLRYNAFNQIVQVNKTDGQHSYYSYDSSGKTVRTASADGIRYLFYHGSKLTDEKITSPGQDTHLVSYLGVAKSIDGVIQTYNETNYRGDVVGVLNKIKGDLHKYNLSQSNIYSPYGMVFHCKKNSLLLPLYQKTLYGFDGEITDPATGWQFLGNGNRAYNPGMRYFFNEDPAGGGYGFGSNNPVMNSDPSGNTPRWLGSAFTWFGNITSFGLNALHAKWANIASTVMMTGLTIITLGASAASYGGAVLGAAVAGGTAIYGSIPVIAASVPSNKGLNMAASVIGLTEMAATLATAAVDMGFFLSAPLSLASSDKTGPEIGNLNMLKIPALIHSADGTTSKPVIDADMPIQLLLNQASKYIVKTRNGEALELSSFEDVTIIWKILKSHPNELVACDTSVMLMAAQKNMQPLLLSDIQLFLRQKKTFSELIFSPSNSIVAGMNYVLCFKSVLEKLSNGDKFISVAEAPIKSFSKILTRPCEIAVLQHLRHIAVVARNDERSWSLYRFYRDGRVEITRGSVQEIKHAFFDDASQGTERSDDCIYGYIKLQYWSAVFRDLLQMMQTQK